ncbi:hypothetical protein [uncultured Pelagimonas sp.]|uniref:hypothetical protein n=1 Tax=uncultured Pelagimonas sp. TaxID=1618102 RepID=UPI0026102F56|nr:hypothetical protein [uncultured Pelagimonas sp.]
MLVRRCGWFLLVLVSMATPVFAADLKLSFGTGTAHTEHAALDGLTKPLCNIPTLLDCGELELGDAVNLVHGQRLSLELSQPVLSFGPKTQLLVGGAVSYARQVYRLEDGLDILTDPMRITLQTWSIWGGLELQRNFAFDLSASREKKRPARRGQLALGLGAVHSRFHAHLRSALLDVKATGETQTLYVRGRFEIDLLPPKVGAPTPQWRAAITRFDNQSWDMTTGLVLAF